MTSELTTIHFLAALAALAGATVLFISYLDYRHYCSLGDHGLPGNFQGWKKQLQMSRYARRDTTIPAPYNLEDIVKDYGPHATKSFLKTPLKAREGNRPKIPGFVAPQRQVSDIASPEMKNGMNAHLDSLVRTNSKLLQRELSRIEGPVPAVQLHPSLPVSALLERTRSEIIHVHPPDGTTHLILSLEDSKSVIERAWGQRHRLSGGKMLPWNYTLVYAPRDEEEFEVWKGVVEAAASFCCADVGCIEGI
ncbi:hypothetical protein BLS_008384 [Venturia inaequalis]|uniref:Luciferase domain-containing protein n=1 Tax=Venturia inaequalis TaxID=5025 RepID=A0A8H3UUC0_VENIN|nr:hypothetical protein BLS_008384 [Venturia inaequalis]KAE9975486.1 hypothetical protein EG328_003145 [Venturia inaequalis]KAE9989790.1 hypothetical protein EG327_002257 [Venturia inaequalis]RDI85636.1 hypothetical protein Vi05172_g4318 [Venturia inaequalis]